MALVLPTSRVLHGAKPLGAVYVGTHKAWEPVSGGPEMIAGCVLGLVASDVPAGTLATWPDRSPLGNYLTPSGTTPSTGLYVSPNTVNYLATHNPLPFYGNTPMHLLMKIRTRPVNGSFMGWGAPGTGAMFDLWNYGPGTLIYHGYGGGYDTVNAPQAFTPDVWHIFDVSYAGPPTQIINMRVDDNADNPYQILVPAITTNALLLGQGRYSPGGDFDTTGLFIYDRVLTDTERTQVRSYLTAMPTTP